MRYYKLVRDRIPEILMNKGVSNISHPATDVEYEEKLRDKLIEEIGEFLQETTVEEMADVLEVLEAFQALKGMTYEAVLAAKEKKAKENGTFKNRIILEETRS